MKQTKAILADVQGRILFLRFPEGDPGIVGSISVKVDGIDVAGRGFSSEHPSDVFRYEVTGDQDMSGLKKGTIVTVSWR